MVLSHVKLIHYYNIRILAPILLLALLTDARHMRAQQISPTTPPPPPAETSPAPAEPVFDPFHAEKSIEVGTFYMKKGNYDAAIDRFIDATHFQPKLARPWTLLGEAYEKKRDNGSAIEAYKRYLEIFPGVEDAAKVKKRITMLEEKAGQQASKRHQH